MPQVRLRRFSPVDFGAGAFRDVQALGDQLMRQDEERQQAETVLQASEIDTRIARRLEDVENTALRDAQSYDQIFPIWDKAIQDIRKEELDSLKKGDKLRQFVELSFNRRQVQSYQRIKGAEEVRFKDEGRARFLGDYKEGLRLLAAHEPGTPEYIFEERQLDSKMAAVAATNFFSAQEMEQIRGDHEHQKDLGRAYYLLENDPDRLLKELGAESYPGLKGQERNALKNHAQAEIAERKRIAKQAEQERLDGINSDLLTRNAQGALTVAEVLQRDDLPFDAKRFWVDRIERQKEEAVRRAEHDENKRQRELDRAEVRADREERRRERLERRKNERFTQSDGGTRAEVLSGILSNPQEWSQDRILRLMGNGLSIADTLQAVNMQKELTKPDPSRIPTKYNPLNSALSTLDGLRKSYAFTKEGVDRMGTDERVTDATAAAELRIKNDEEYNKVVDEVIRRSQAGENPRAVLNELMEPYFAQKTKGWMEKVASWFTSPLDPAQAAERGQPLTYRQQPQEHPVTVAQPDLDAEARAFLERHGKLVNEETLQKAKAYLKSKRK